MTNIYILWALLAIAGALVAIAYILSEKKNKK